MLWFMDSGSAVVLASCAAGPSVLAWARKHISGDHRVQKHISGAVHATCNVYLFK